MDVFAKYIPNFLLILLRAGVVIGMLPFYGSKSIPAQFKIGLVIAIALILTPIVNFEFSRSAISALVIREVIFGMVLGLSARFVFLAVDMAGQMISNAVGLSMATLFNPEIGQSTVVSNLYGIIVKLVFLAMDAHHDLIYIFVKSYEWLPAGTIDVKNLVAEMVGITGGIFTIALKLSAPIIIIMVITNLLLGFIYKAAPQINIFFVGYPLVMFIGFVLMLLGLPFFIQVTGNDFALIREEMTRVIELAKG
jgi:flagellar biosynthetic protein FliR